MFKRLRLLRGRRRTLWPGRWNVEDHDRVVPTAPWNLIRETERVGLADISRICRSTRFSSLYFFFFSSSLARFSRPHPAAPLKKALVKLLLGHQDIVCFACGLSVQDRRGDASREVYQCPWPPYIRVVSWWTTKMPSIFFYILRDLSSFTLTFRWLSQKRVSIFIVSSCVRMFCEEARKGEIFMRKWWGYFPSSWWMLH